MNEKEKAVFLDLGRPVKRSAGAGLDNRAKPIAGNREHKWPERNRDGKPTFWGIYLKLLCGVQNERSWEDETCRRYDAAVCNTLAEAFVRDGLAFEDLLEDDVLLRWETVLDRIESKSLAQICHIQLRVFWAAAYEKGYTRTLLWGMVSPVRNAREDWEESEDDESPEAVNEREGKRIAREKIDNSRCFLPETEYRINRYSRKESEYHGEYMGGLTGQAAGLRTSEITALDYGDLVKIGQCWALRVTATSVKDSREIEDTGKTENYSRFVDVSDSYAEFVLQRKQRIAEESRVSESVVDGYPLVCVGTDYTKRCTQKECNRAVKDAFKRCGVEEDLVRTAAKAVRDSAEIGAKSEDSATNYLFRHQRMTNSVFCGCSQAEIFAEAGHKIETPNVDKSDFGNPDIFARLAKKQRRRTLTQCIDRTPQCEEAVLPNGVFSAAFDGDVHLRIPAGTPVSITVRAAEMNVPLHVEMPDNHPFTVLPASWTQEKSGDELCIRNFLNRCAQGILEMADGELSAITEAAEDGTWLAESEEKQLSAVGVSHRNPAPEEPKASEAAAYPAHTEETAPAKAQKTGPAAPLQTIAVAGDIYLVTNQERILPIQNELLLGKIGQAGNKLVALGKSERVAGACAHDPTHEALAVSTGGAAYRIPAGERMDEYLAAPEHAECADALRKGGILLSPLQSALDLLLATRGGRIQRIPAERLADITECGRQLVQGKTAEEGIQAAIQCADGQAPLLVSTGGQALRLLRKDVFKADAARNKSIQAMRLHDKATLATCAPYSDDTRLVAITKGGMGAVIQDRLPEQHRGSQGVKFLTLAGMDAVTAVLGPTEMLLLVRSDGNVLCTELGTVSPLKRGARGRQFMKIRGGHAIAASLPLFQQRL